MTRYRPTLRSETLSLLVSAWIILAVNKVFWTNALAGFGDHTTSLVAFAIGIAALTAAVIVSVSVKYLTKPLFILFIISAAAASWFMERFGAIIDTDMIRNAAQTTPAEAGHLMTPAFLIHMLLYAVLPTLFIVFIRIKHRNFPAKVKHNLAIIIPLLLVTAGVVVWQYPAIASTTRNNQMIIKTLNPITPIVSTVKFAIKSTEESVIVAQPLDLDAKLGAAINQADKPVVTIIVAGETARAQDFSLGGYERKTNPELEKRNIFYFKNTQSCGTATAVSIPCMFSILEHRNYSHDGALASENLLDVLSHAGVDVTWWENNTGDKQVAARVNMRSFSMENDAQFCVQNECRDEDMVAELGGWLDQVKTNTTLVLHQLGSHGPAYYQRYNEEERIFRPDCRTEDFAACTQEEIRNAYDNTIVATDKMLANVIDLLKARSDRLASAMVYMSDHGESLGEKGLYLHGLPYIIAPQEQTHVPFIMWISDSYSKLFKLSTNCLKDKLDKPYSHDNLFHTVLGLMDIDAKHYEASKDVTASCRNAAQS